MSGRCSPLPSGGHPAFTDRPTVPELKELLSELVDWRRFGAHLPGITKQKIVRLGKFGNQSVGSRKEALFTRWLREYEKASWNDVITALYKSEEYKLLSSVTDEIKRRYTSSKHDQTTSESSQATNGKEQTTSIANDVPNDDDELKKDAKRAITRNIDKLTSFISSSENALYDIVLGCAAKELIPTSLKNQLLDPLTGKSTQARASELLNYVERLVSMKLTYLDEFLAVLTAKCGKFIGEVARKVAQEYGHELPQYDDMIGAKPVIGAVEGADSSDDTANRSEITLISESQVKEDIKSLYQSFGSLVSNVRFSLFVSECNVYKIAIYIEAIIGPLSITQGTTVDELFDKIQPHYSFLDCELLEAIVNEFLSAKTELKVELIQYNNKVIEFKTSSRLLHIKTAIEGSLISKQDVTDTTCRVVIKLHEIWGRITLKHFHDVLIYLFPTRKNILAHIHIEGGSIIISFIAPLSQSQYIIDIVLSKKNFLQRIGIIEVSINDQSILPAGVDDINLNQSLLEASEEGDQLGVSILLQLGASINYRNGEGKTSLMLACSGGHEHVVQTLLSANADVNSQDWRRYTALMRAVESHSIKIVSSLLEHNADPNIIAQFNNTALIMACTSCQTDVVKLLLSCNADVAINNYEALQVSTKTDDHLNILLQLIPIILHHVLRDFLGFILTLNAVEYGQPLIIAALLKCVDPNITTEQLHLFASCCKGDYRTVEKLIFYPTVNLTYPLLPPLTLASSCGHLPIVELLLKQHIPVDIKTIGNYTSLMYASANGHLLIVELLLRLHANVNIQNINGYTALMLASKNGHHQVVELLLNQHADVSIRDTAGSTALILASYDGHYQVAERLLKEYADINICADNGCTALIMASQNGHHQVAELLLKEHADVNIRADNGCTALFFPCENGRFQLAELLIKYHANVNIRNTNGSTALMLASQNGHHQIVELLLNEQADINLHNNYDKTALMLASQNGHHQVVELLLNHHANVNVCNRYGVTALILASENGHHKVVKQLLNEHADLDIRNNDGCTALILASHYGHYQVVEQLLLEHADVNICAVNGPTALILASENGHHQIVELLLNQHADVNIHPISGPGCTALIFASQNGHHQVVELLLNKNADVNIRNTDGFTAIMYASQNDHYQVVELLLKEHADVNICNNNGFAALVIACAKNRQKIVKLLLKNGINDSDKWLSLMIARYFGHNEIVEILLDELDTSQADSSNSTGFKPVYNELISKSEGQDDYTIQPVAQSSLDPFMLNQKEKEILMKNLTSKMTSKSPTTFASPTDVESLKGKPSPVSTSPLTTLLLDYCRVM